jgi:murein DD-endopeptidase MepM/ murein hydrolase activator NlpD
MIASRLGLLAALIAAALPGALHADAAPHASLAVVRADHGDAARTVPADSAAMDLDEPDAPTSGVTFGRGLDLQGTPIRLIGSRPASRSGSGLARNPAAYGSPVMGTPAGSPVRFHGISSGFGSRWHPVYGGSRFHAGIDMVAPTGTPVVATAPGIVATAGGCGGYGLCVAIDHGGGVVTIYGHLSRIDVAPGTRIERGQSLGQVGSTGVSTGPHLHYEIRRSGQPLNPQPYL